MDRSGFTQPDFSAPIDLGLQKTLVPPHGTVKGMQLQALVNECTRHGHSLGRRYTAFLDYPGEELIELLAESAACCHPDVSPREGLRRLGHIAYPTLAQSMVGRVVFGMVGSDPKRLISLVAKGYAISNSTGTAAVLGMSPDAAIIRLEGMYSFIDAWHVGIIEGALTTVGVRGAVCIKLRSPTAADFLIEW